MTDYRVASFILEPVTPLHIGSGRAGMVAKSHSFIPAHLFGYALAAQRGRQAGGQPKHFQDALKEVDAAARFAPAFILNDQNRIEDWRKHPERYLMGQHHVSLHLDSRSAADSALFETESLSPRHLAGPRQGQPLRLGGMVWLQDSQFAGRDWSDWLNALRLGGELKGGQGHVRLVDWQMNRPDFHGWGRVDAKGLHLAPQQRLWGAALGELADISDAPLRPWLGRTYDFKQGSGGFGRHLADVVLVRLHGRHVGQGEGVFLPARREGSRWGCWEAAPLR